MLFTIFTGIAQFERDLTSERTKEGILAAKKQGKTVLQQHCESVKTDIRLQWNEKLYGPIE